MASFCRWDVPLQCSPVPRSASVHSLLVLKLVGRGADWLSGRSPSEGPVRPTRGQGDADPAWRRSSSRSRGSPRRRGDARGLLPEPRRRGSSTLREFFQRAFSALRSPSPNASTIASELVVQLVEAEVALPRDRPLTKRRHFASDFLVAGEQGPADGIEVVREEMVPSGESTCTGALLTADPADPGAPVLPGHTSGPRPSPVEASHRSVQGNR